MEEEESELPVIVNCYRLQREERRDGRRWKVGGKREGKERSIWRK